MGDRGFTRRKSASTGCRIRPSGGQIYRVYQTPIDKGALKKLYGSKDSYVKKVDARPKELERAGWSLPVYHDLILADARAAEF